MKQIKIGDRLEIRAGKPLAGWIGVYIENRRVEHGWEYLIDFKEMGGKKVWRSYRDVKLKQTKYTKNTIGDALNMLESKKGDGGAKKTWIAIDLEVKEGIIKTTVVVGLIKALLTMLTSIYRVEVKTGVETELEDNSNME